MTADPAFVHSMAGRTALARTGCSPCQSPNQRNLGSGEALNWRSTHDITTGCDADTFCPHQTATRAHVAAFLYRSATKPQSWGTDAHLHPDFAP